MRLVCLSLPRLSLVSVFRVYFSCLFLVSILVCISRVYFSCLFLVCSFRSHCHLDWSNEEGGLVGGGTGAYLRAEMGISELRKKTV
jgi:hypothetical protein